VLLTVEGSARARAVTCAAARMFKDAPASLSSQERHNLDQLIGVVLAGLIRKPGATRWICRLYNNRCVRPIGRATSGRSGSTPPLRLTWVLTGHHNRSDCAN